MSWLDWWGLCVVGGLFLATMLLCVVAPLLMPPEDEVPRHRVGRWWE